MIRQQMSGELPFEEAVERAVDTCIRQGILSEILQKSVGGNRYDFDGI